MIHGAGTRPLNDSTDLSSNQQPGAPVASSGQAQLIPGHPPLFHKIFIGADGLRTGWSLLIFFVLLVAVLKGAGAVIKLLHLLPARDGNGPELSPRFGIFAEGLPLLATLGVTWIMSKIERRPNSVYGLDGKNLAPRFFAGLAWGVTCLSLLVLALWERGLLVIDSRLLYGSAAVRYGAIWLLIFLLVGLLEEYLTRGYVLFTLARGLAGICMWLFKTRHSKTFGFWTAAVVLSLLFGLGP